MVTELLNAVGLTGEGKHHLGRGHYDFKERPDEPSCTVLSKIQIKKFNEIAQSDRLADLLKIENKDDLVDYMWGRELIDLFIEYPQSGLNAQEFIGLFTSYASTTHSIASSLSAHPEEVHLTVAIVRYGGNGKDRKKGVCSSYLAERVGERVHVTTIPNKNFKLPEDPSIPIIMVGPGTGNCPISCFC